MVLPDDQVSQRFQDAGNGVADDRAAQVPHVHLFGQVGARVVDDHPLRRLDRLHRRGLQRASQELTLQMDVDEARSGDLQPLHQIVHLGSGDHRLGDLSGTPLQRLGRTHGPVGLVVTELGFARDLDQWRRSGAGDAGKRPGEAVGQQVAQVHSVSGRRDVFRLQPFLPVGHDEGNGLTILERWPSGPVLGVGAYGPLVNEDFLARFADDEAEALGPVEPLDGPRFPVARWGAGRSGDWSWPGLLALAGRLLGLARPVGTVFPARCSGGCRRCGRSSKAETQIALHEERQGDDGQQSEMAARPESGGKLDGNRGEQKRTGRKDEKGPHDVRLRLGCW